MTAKLILALALTTTTLLTACSAGYNACGNPVGCWKGYFKETPCGTYVTSRCEKLCDLCISSGPQCDACLHCVTHDGCGYCQVKGGTVGPTSFRTVGLGLRY